MSEYGPQDHWFEYAGEKVPMYYHLYNLTHLNERCVELAIARAWVEARNQEHKWIPGLEVGNVLGHYHPYTHHVVDRDEPRAWYQDQHYINDDWLEWAGGYIPHSYPWVVSISTVEHMSDPPRAIDLLHEVGHQGLVTFPSGVDPRLDDWLEAGAPGYYSVRTLCRVQNDHGGWEETPLPQVRPYGPWANSVAILEWGVES